MAYTLFDLAYRLARELGIVFEGTATAGTTTTITDSIYLRDRFEDDYFNAGTVWLIYDAGGLGASPQGEMSRVTDFAKTTGVVTMTAMSIPVADGDRYAIANAAFTKDQLIQAINQVLAEIPIPVIDDSTITTADNATEYTLPTEMLDQGIEVWINVHDTTDDNYWRRTHDWYIQESQTGTGKELIFRTQPPSPYHLRIKYWIPHTPLYAAHEKLRETVDINRVVLTAAYRLLLWKKAQKAQEDPYLDQRIAELGVRSQEARWKNPTRKDSIKLGTYGSSDDTETI